MEQWEVARCTGSRQVQNKYGVLTLHNTTTRCSSNRVTRLQQLFRVINIPIVPRKLMLSLAESYFIQALLKWIHFDWMNNLNSAVTSSLKLEFHIEIPQVIAKSINSTLSHNAFPAARVHFNTLTVRELQTDLKSIRPITVHSATYYNGLYSVANSICEVWVQRHLFEELPYTRITPSAHMFAGRLFGPSFHTPLTESSETRIFIQVCVKPSVDERL